MYNSADVLWTLWGAAMVFFMQAGFSLCEAGLTRAKNTGNILMKNLMDFCIGTPLYWLVGFGLMFGGAGAFIGGLDPLIRGSYDFGTLPLWCYVIFQTVFCATAATIVSGSMAERTNFKAYCLYSALISMVVYPISGHWIWGGGWLSSLGFHDFAGSTAVHMVGGITACIGDAMLGPRIGKYTKDGKPRAIPGHNLTALATGVFILWFCWFGFNGASTVSLSSDESMLSASLVFMNTNMAAAVATCATMLFTWIRYKKPDVSMTFNGTLAGLVAITAGCDMVSPVGAFFIGLMAGILVVLAVEFFDKVDKIDDPVGAVSVHGVCGAFGTICVGLFATDGGLFYGGGVRFLLVQLAGVVSVAVWVLVTMTIIFKVIDKLVGHLRSADAVRHQIAHIHLKGTVPLVQADPAANHDLHAILRAECQTGCVPAEHDRLDAALRIPQRKVAVAAFGMAHKVCDLAPQRQIRQDGIPFQHRFDIPVQSCYADYLGHTVSSLAASTATPMALSDEKRPGTKHTSGKRRCT